MLSKIPSAWRELEPLARIGTLLLFLVLTLPGAYLEFPSDAWEHLRRTLKFGNVTSFAAYDFRFKFSYAWHWTFFKIVSIEYYPWIAGAISAFWQIMIAAQAFRVFRAADLSQGEALVMVGSFFAFFGNSSFGFRYYGLSSTPLAYLAYLFFLENLIFVASRKRGLAARDVFSGIAVGLIAYFSHRQALLFVAVSGLAGALYRIASVRSRRTGLALFFAASALLVSRFPEAYLKIAHARWLAETVGQTFYHELPTFTPTLYRFPITFRLLDRSYPFIDCYGLHGLLGIAAALLLLAHRRHCLLALLCIAPTAMLLYAPFVLLAASVTDSWNLYRLLYAFPASLALTLFTIELVRSRRSQLAVLSALIAVSLAVLPHFPFRGRLLFQLTPSNRLLSLADVYPVSKSLRNAFQQARCVILSDDVTGFAIGTLLPNVDVRANRLVSESPLKGIEADAELKSFLLNKDSCFVVIASQSLISQVPESFWGRVSGHWPANLVRERLLLPLTEPMIAAAALRAGWFDVGTAPSPFLVLGRSPVLDKSLR